MDADEQEFPAGTPRRRLGNFRTAELAGRVRTVLREAGVPSSDRVDPARPELAGRLLDRLVQLVGAGGNRVWVPRARFREAVRALAEARRAAGTGHAGGAGGATGESGGTDGPGRDGTG